MTPFPILFPPRRAASSSLGKSPSGAMRHLRVGLLIGSTLIAVALWTAPLRHEWALSAASLKTLMAAVAENPEDNRARYHLAWRLEQLGQTPHAAAAYAVIVRREDDERAWRGLARMLTAEGRIPAATAALSDYAARHPNDRDAISDLERIASGKTPSESGEAPSALVLLLGDADALHRGEKKEDALRAYETLLRRIPKNAAAWAGMGATFDALNRPAEAFAAYDRAATLDPALSDIQYLLAERAYRAGLLRDAARRFRRVTKADPANHRAWYQLGVILVSARAFPTEARDAFAAAASLAPNNAAYRVELAEARNALNDAHGAEADFRAARRLAPTDAIIAGRMGVFLASRDDAARRGEALRLLQEAISAAPEHELFRQELARLVLSNGDAARAIALLEPLTQRPRNPGQVNTFYILSQAYKRQGDVVRAQEFLARSRAVRAYYDAALATQEAAERNPRDAVLRLRLARLHRAAGEFAKALDQYHAAERLAPGVAAIRQEREIFETSLKNQNRMPDMAQFAAMVERSAP